MYIALQQFNPKVGALRDNAERALAQVEELAARPYPPDLVIFPPFALTGAPVLGLQVHDAFTAQCLETNNDFAERVALPTLIGTMSPSRRPDDSYLCLPEVIYCQDGQGENLRFANILERLLDDEIEMMPYLTLGDQTVSILLDEIPDADDDSFLDSDILVLLMAKEYLDSNEMFTASQQFEYLCEIARANAVWLVCVNLVGAQDNLVFDGASLVVCPEGRIIASAEPFAEQSLLVNLATSSPEVKVRPLLPYEADWRALSLSIADYLDKNGFSDCLLGLSGGIDSAVVATLATDALGASHVHGVLMPSKISSRGSVEDATRLAANLGIATLELPIGSLYDAFIEFYQHELGESGSALALQNIQARLRTIHLMHLSNSYGWLLLNTGNKSEAAMGYSTLYGDTAGALAPLGNVYKTDVYGLAQWRNQQGLVIPHEIIDKPPSAELYPGQKDSDALPDYEILDRILRLHIDRNFGADQITTWLRRIDEEAGISPELVLRVLDAVRAAEFKRRQEPLAPVYASVDTSSERNWPITNGFMDRHRNLPTASEVFDQLGDIYQSDGPRGFSIMQN